MTNIKNYFRRLYKMRYFIFHLITIGLKNQFRRSKLGILWTFISPMGLTAIMAVVFSVAFHYDYAEYLPYILSGILFWNLFSQTFVAGSSTIIGFDSFIRQCNHPITIYTLTNSMIFLSSFLISMVSLVCIMLIKEPINIIFGVISLPITLIFYAVFSWCGTTISAYIGVQYRDYPMAANLLLQVIWYLSPVFFEEKMFEANALIYAWFRINPVTHMLNLIRKPFLYGKMPTLNDYVLCLGFIVFLAVIAYWTNVKKERNAIFYL